MKCDNCGWTGKRDDTKIVRAPSPDGTYTRIYVCPSCEGREPVRYGG